MSTITLCGFPISNYYSKVKIALLEKGIAFVEEVVMTGSTDEAVLRDSPLAKIPFIRTPSGPLCESAVIVEYLEAIQPEPRLIPVDPFAAAKVRELCTFIELHVELSARELYGQAFFGGTASDSTKDRVRRQLAKNVSALARLVKFGPYIAGPEFTVADVAAWCSLPLAAMASKSVLGEDVVSANGIDWKPYVSMVGQRPSVAAVAAERKAAMAKRP
jgi:glutathione S-transferase